MNKRLISIILMCVYLISPMTYAADVSAPAYQVDVTHSVAVDVGGPVAMAEAKSTQSKNTNLTSLNDLSKPRQSTLIVACGYESVENANASRVSWGDSIGIGRPI